MKKFSLSFKGGLARGLAGVGIIRFFQEEKMTPTIYAGSSSGAIVAAAAALGMSWKDSLDVFSSINFYKVCSLKSVLFKHSLVDHDKYFKEYNNFCGNKNIEDLKHKLVIFATDAQTGKRVLLTKGNIARALVASSAFPFIFPEEYIDGRKIIDGDLTSSYSVKLLKDMGVQKVVGVGHKTEEYVSKNTLMGKFYDIYTPMNLQIQMLTNKIDPPDFEIKYSMEKYGILNFKGLVEASERAYQEVKNQKKEIISLLK